MLWIKLLKSGSCSRKLFWLSNTPGTACDNLIVTCHAKDFPNLVTLAQLGLTLAVHTAGCERGFSVQNNILTPSRNRLTPVVQQKLIQVKLGPERASFNCQATLLKQRVVKDRRIYELRKTNPKL